MILMKKRLNNQIKLAIKITIVLSFSVSLSAKKSAPDAQNRSSTSIQVTKKNKTIISDSALYLQKINTPLWELNEVELNKYMVMYLNEVRKKHGLPPLKYDKALSKTALEQAMYVDRQLKAGKPFDPSMHIDSFGRWPSERIAKVWPKDRLDDENIYITNTDESIVKTSSGTIKKVITLFMKSTDGHRETMLGLYTHLGIGYKIGGGSPLVCLTFAREKKGYKPITKKLKDSTR